MGRSTDYQHLEDENKKLWERLVVLEKNINSEEELKKIKEHSKKAAEYRNKSNERLQEISNIKDNLSSLEQEYKSSILVFNQLIEKSQIHTKDIETNSSSLLETIDKFDDITSSHPNLEEEIEEFKGHFEEISDTQNKTSIAFKDILNKKKDLDNLHREIIGYSEKDEDDEIIKTEGLKGYLERSYNEIENKLKGLNQEYTLTKTTTKERLNNFIEEQKKDFAKKSEKHESSIEGIKQRIESLLPSSLTAGLSSAFINKKEEEEIAFKGHKRAFNFGIFLITIAAITSLCISLNSIISHDQTLEQFLEKAPLMFIAFLPLYIPLIWVTISANKKVNLSKRLIEEYSHKQVLSMTIEGLTQQIEDIEDSDTSTELKNQLIRNFLKVSNENPGKLISDYQKSDNPILNMFDRKKKKEKEKRNKKELEHKDIMQPMSEEAVKSIND